jgi:hypothetical protein
MVTKDEMEDGWIMPLNMKKTMEFHLKVNILTKLMIKNEKCKKLDLT